MAATKKTAAAKAAAPKKAATDAEAPADVSSDDDAPAVTPTLLRSDGVGSLDEVPDNTPPVRAAADDSDKDDKDDAPAGYAYVVHPKSGARCLVDAKSVPELEVDGYKRAGAK